MSPFIVPSLKKIVGANLEKIDKVDFRDTHTDRHTDRSDLIGPSLAGVQKKETGPGPSGPTSLGPGAQSHLVLGRNTFDQL